MDAQQQQQQVVVVEKKKNDDYMFYHFESMDQDWDPNESAGAVYRRTRGCWHWASDSAEDTTSIPAMRFTDDPGNHWAGLQETLQIYSIKVAEIGGGLQWPLHVYGVVAARDNADRNRNIIFARPRSNCQTITQEDPYLALTGPARAIVMRYDPGKLEFLLKVKGAAESDQDRELSFRFVNINTTIGCDRTPSSDNSTLELTYHRIESSVEATIILKLVGGSAAWPRGLRGVFAASTVRADDDDREVTLLAFGSGDDGGEQQQQPPLPVADDGCTIQLARRVVSVRFSHTERLRVSVRARSGDESTEAAAAHSWRCFCPKNHGRSYAVLKVKSCKIRVTVAWSLLSTQWG